MLQPHQVEELICIVSALDRSALEMQFLTYRANFPLDFTPDFLRGQPVERLRHIFLALCLQTQRMPECPLSEAA